MEWTTYSNEVLMKLFTVYDWCDEILSRGCSLNQMYLETQPRTEGLKQKAIRNLTKLSISEEDNIIDVLLYFHACSQATIKSAKDDIGLSHH